MRHEKEEGIMDGMGDVLFLSLDRFFLLFFDSDGVCQAFYCLSLMVD